MHGKKIEIERLMCESHTLPRMSKASAKSSIHVPVADHPPCEYFLAHLKEIPPAELLKVNKVLTAHLTKIQKALTVQLEKSVKSAAKPVKPVKSAAKPVKPAAAHAEWCCKVCTMLNPKEESKCNMCDKPRSSVSAALKKPEMSRDNSMDLE